MSAEPREPVRSAEALAERLADVITASTVIVCVGHSLIGDDGAGCAVAEELNDTLPWPVFDAQTVPESYLMKIVNLKPESIILIDALEIGGEPGSVYLLPSRNLTGQSPSTHGPAPLMFLDVVQKMHPCRQLVLGIQPEAGVFGTGLSEAAQAAVDLIVRAFRILADASARN